MATRLTLAEVKKRLSAFARTFKNAENEQREASIFWTRFYERFGLFGEKSTIDKQPARKPSNGKSGASCSKKLSYLLILFFVSTVALAGDLEDGFSAHKRKDYAVALIKYKLAAHMGNSEGQFRLGMMYYNGEGSPVDFTEAIRWIKLSSENGHPVAQFMLGSMYHTGKKLNKNIDEAVRLYKLSARQGFEPAQFFLGQVYEFGIDVLQDYTEAMFWYRISANQGNAKAQFRLGLAYSGGRGVEKSSVEAVRWYSASAKLGNSQSQKMLGLMYVMGDGVLQNHKLAHMWLNISSSLGEQESSNLRDTVANEMTKTQIEQAQRMAKRCVDSNYKSCDEI